MKQLLFALYLLVTLLVSLSAASALAYDYTVNIGDELSYSYVAGYKFKYAATKGGPYTGIFDCGKPALKEDKSFDCLAKGITVAPGKLYGIVVSVMESGVESSPSNEATWTAAAPFVRGIK